MNLPLKAPRTRYLIINGFGNPKSQSPNPGGIRKRCRRLGESAEASELPKDGKLEVCILGFQGPEVFGSKIKIEWVQRL